MEKTGFRKGWILLAIFAALVFLPLFKPGFMIFVDNGAHLAESYYFSEHLVPEQKWMNGWCQLDFMGFPFQLDRYQTGHWLIYGLTLLSIPEYIAYKLIVTFAYLFAGTSLYFLLERKFGGKTAFIFAGLFFLQTQVIVRILEGMWNEYLALGLLFIFLNLLDKYASALDWRKAVRLGLVLGLMIFTHLYSALAGFLIVTLYFVFGKKQKKDLTNYALMFGTAFLASFFYIYNVVGNSKWYGNFVQTWSVKNSLQALGFLFLKRPEGGVVVGQYADSLALSLPSLVLGAIFLYSTYRFFKERTLRKDSFAKVILTFIGIVLFISTGIWYAIPLFGKIPFVKDILYDRFIIFARIGMILFAAFVLTSNSRFKKIMHDKKALIAVMIGFVLIILFVPKVWFTTSESREMNDLFYVWNFIEKNIPENDTRILFEGNEGNLDGILGASHLKALTYHYTGKLIFSDWFGRSYPTYPIDEYARTSAGLMFNISVEKITDQEIQFYFNKYNIGYAVITEGAMREKLSRNPAFQKLTETQKFSIFRFENHTSELVAFSGPAEYSVVQGSPDHLIIKIKNNEPNNIAEIKIQEHPYWKAYLDGTKIPITQNKYALMEIPLKETGEQTLELRYETKKWPFFASAAFIITAFIIIRPKRRK